MICNPIGTIIDVLGLMNIVDVTRTFPTTVPIYGLIVENTTRTADCFANFKSDTEHTLKLNMFNMYWGYVDGNNGYTSVSTWRSIRENRYITFFDDNRSNPYVDVYVNFTEINGYRPGNYKTGYLFALVDSRDMS